MTHNICVGVIVWFDKQQKKDRFQPVRNGLLPVSQKDSPKMGVSCDVFEKDRQEFLILWAGIPGVTSEVCGVNVWRER